MKNRGSLLYLPVIIFGMTQTNSSVAIEPLTQKELYGLCKNFQVDSESSESQQCIRYIKGFIDGAVAIDSGITSDPQADKRLTFSERAFKTRINNRLNRYAAPVSNDFCLGKPVPIKEVINKVAYNLLSKSDSDELALFVVYTTLRQEYPCK
ncbi:Rap1a/Tai family immunity protein [Flocculibacter collagenilyticus]|uniref:Rap1a/Tai family immunity protein n=1 Tax=Flocculibacter collagenilyticus TaxID=2744479 RepID=UPI0018F32C51|nr:Rap1a/Tai family immunity protein [Flocculibacter collagenilyticus]